MFGKQLALKYWIFCLTLPSIVAIDQVTKAIVVRMVPPYSSIPVIDGFFDITHVKNTGAAFGFLAGDVNTLRTLFFIGITVGALTLILFIFRKIQQNRIIAPLYLSMIMAGALGNLIDRIHWGYVVDFFDVYWRGNHWPAFNIADSAITVGVVLLFIDNLFFHHRGPGSMRQGQEQE